MKTSSRIILVSLSLFIISSGIAYALNGTKSPKLPWQGTPAARYDAIHNVGSSSAAEVRFTSSGGSVATTINTIVIDSVTGLKWQSYKNTSSADYAHKETWESGIDAQAYCAGLSLGGYGAGSWRLPTIKEAMSIADYSQAAQPWINQTYFGIGYAGQYWTSTPQAIDSTKLFVAYISGQVNIVPTSKAGGIAYTRCVLK